MSLMAIPNVLTGGGFQRLAEQAGEREMPNLNTANSSSGKINPQDEGIVSSHSTTAATGHSNVSSSADSAQSPADLITENFPSSV